jgi:gliding motility-associated-like protein
MKGFSDINNLNNIDGLIKESLKDFKDTPSNDLWDKLSNNLDKIQVGHSVNPNAATNPVNSIGSKIISVVSKSWFYYAAAASVVTIGVVAAITYFTLNADEKSLDKQEAINKPDEKVVVNDIIKETDKNNDKIYTPQLNNNDNNKEKSLNTNNILIDNQVQYSDNDNTDNKSDQNINKNDNDNKKELNNQNIIADQDKNNITPKKEEDKKKDLPVADNKKDKTKKEVKAQEETEEEIIEENADNQLTMNSEDQTEFGDEFRLEIPNAFTPNGDGINDRFVIGKLSSVENPSLLVYDSRGKVVFKSSKYQNDWDGYNAPDGTYYFYLQYSYKNKVQVKGGSIYISR